MYFRRPRHTGGCQLFKVVKLLGLVNFEAPPAGSGLRTPPLPFRFINLTEAINAFSRRKQAEDNTVADSIGDIELTALSFRHAHCFL